MSLITLAALGQLKPDTSQFDPIKNYNQTIVQPCDDAGGTLDGYACVIPPPPPPPPIYVPEPVTGAYNAPGDTLVGSIGYALSGGNCINQVPLALRGDGNPITWLVTTQTPYIGGAVLFWYNHTGRITGLWSNGDIEIAQENWWGPPQTRFPRSAFRGFR